MEGYPKLASLMSLDPEFAIYRRFGALNAQNLLYYQAELIGLEADLRAIEAEDRNSEDSVKHLFAENWFELSNAETGKGFQYQKVLQLRKVLKEYNECLIQQSQIAKLEKPLSYDLKMLRRWLEHSDHGNLFLFGLEAKAWDQAYDKDLVAIPRPDSEIERDTLSQFFLGTFIELYHGTIGRFHVKPSAGDTAGNHVMIRYSDSKLLHLANLLGTVLSSALPVASMVALNFVQRTLNRLIVVAIFTMTFSMILSRVTNARRVEIFTATAVFAAVQVVFMGSTNTDAQG